MLDEPRITHKFRTKLDRALDKITEKGRPISEALRRAHAAMLRKAQLLFKVPTFNANQPGTVDK